MEALVGMVICIGMFLAVGLLHWAFVVRPAGLYGGTRKPQEARKPSPTSGPYRTPGKPSESPVEPEKATPA